MFDNTGILKEIFKLHFKEKEKKEKKLKRKKFHIYL